MATGYTRQNAADIATGQVIEAAHHNEEFDSIQAAFSSSTGHNHDGTAGGGAPIDLTVLGSTLGPLPVSKGGTNAITAGDARIQLGLVIGTNVQAFSARLNEIAALAPSSDHFIVGNGSAWTLETPANARTSLGLGTMATQGSNSVTITGGSITGLSTLTTSILTASGTVTLGAASHIWPASDGTANQVLSTDGSGTLAWRTVGISNTDELLKVSSNDTSAGYLNGKLVAGSNITLVENNNGSNETLSVAWSSPTHLAAIEGLSKTDGNFIVANGTTWVAEGGSTARASLGLIIGTNVQAWSTHLDAVSGISKSDGNFIVGDGTTWVAEGGSTARTSLGLGSLATLSSINNSNWSGTALAIANGGTGATSAAAALTALGAAANSITITAGSGLNGGGDLSANRTITLDVSDLVEETDVDPTADFLAVRDTSALTTRKALVSNVIKPVSWTYTTQTATTSGTTVELSAAIPSDAVEIEILLNGVSTNTASQPPLIQFGDSGGYETTGYISAVGVAGGSSATDSATDGVLTFTKVSFAAGEAMDGVIRMSRWDTAEHLWIISGTTGEGTTMCAISATKATSGALDRIRLNTPGGTATFDAGEARIRYRTA